jgi:ADP-ribose pyrophosphatase YjhB (NUDIX family)
LVSEAKFAIICPTANHVKRGKYGSFLFMQERRKIKGHAPEKVWEATKEWFPISCIDPVIEYGNQGVIMVFRKLEPYKDMWAFPGLRLLRNETDEEAIKRILKDQLGLEVDPTEREELGSFNAEFGTRQDVSRAFILRVSDDQEIKPNPKHYSEVAIVLPGGPFPMPMGEMYQHFLALYRGRKIARSGAPLTSDRELNSQ